MTDNQLNEAANRQLNSEPPPEPQDSWANLPPRLFQSTRNFLSDAFHHAHQEVLPVVKETIKNYSFYVRDKCSELFNQNEDTSNEVTPPMYAGSPKELVQEARKEVQKSAATAVLQLSFFDQDPLGDFKTPQQPDSYWSSLKKRISSILPVWKYVSSQDDVVISTLTPKERKYYAQQHLEQSMHRRADGTLDTVQKTEDQKLGETGIMVGRQNRLTEILGESLTLREVAYVIGTDEDVIRDMIHDGDIHVHASQSLQMFVERTEVERVIVEFGNAEVVGGELSSLETGSQLSTTPQDLSSYYSTQHAREIYEKLIQHGASRDQLSFIETQAGLDINSAALVLFDRDQLERIAAAEKIPDLRQFLSRLDTNSNQYFSVQEAADILGITMDDMEEIRHKASRNLSKEADPLCHVVFPMEIINTFVRLVYDQLRRSAALQQHKDENGEHTMNDGTKLRWNKSVQETDTDPHSISPKDSGLTLEVDSGLTLESDDSSDSGIHFDEEPLDLDDSKNNGLDLPEDEEIVDLNDSSEEPLDLGGSEIGSLELPEDEESLDLYDTPAPTKQYLPEESLLSPSDEMFLDEYKLDTISISPLRSPKDSSESLDSDSGLELGDYKHPSESQLKEEVFLLSPSDEMFMGERDSDSDIYLRTDDASDSGLPLDEEKPLDLGELEMEINTLDHLQNKPIDLVNRLVLLDSIESNFVGLQDAAQVIGCSVEDLLEMRTNGEIRGFRDGATWKFKKNEVGRVAREREDEKDKEFLLTPSNDSLADDLDSSQEFDSSMNLLSDSGIDYLAPSDSSESDAL